MSWNLSIARPAALALVLATVAGGAPTGGGNKVRSRYAAAAPKIDGRIEAAEWAGADSLVVTARDSKERCIVLVLNDSENLYVAFSAVDDKTRARGPGVFDNVAAWFSGEVGYWLYGDGKLRTEAIDARNQSTAPFPSGADGAAAGPPRAAHMAYELRLPLDEVRAEPGLEVAVGLHCWDDYDRGPSFWWPATVDVFTPSGYGTIALAAKPE